MKTTHVFQSIMLGCLFVMGLDGVLCRADNPVFVNQAFIGESFFLGLFPNTSEWLSLEASTDLSNWTEVASVATTNDVTIIHDPDARSFPERFYRLRRPGFSVEDAEAKWVSHVEGAYQFKLQHMVDYHVFTGTLTVTNGQKTITDAQLDGQPLEQPDPGDFPSIGELYALLREAQLSGCRRVAVIYDPTDGHPAWCVVEEKGQNPDEYGISEFTILSTKAGS